MVPKTYESESMIGMARLGQINQDGSTLDNFIIKPNEAEKLIKSSLILQPVIDKFFPDGEQSLREFNEDNLEIEIFEQRISWNLMGFEPYLFIRTRANNAEIAHDINEQILEQFLINARPKYDQRIKLLVNSLNTTNKQIKELKKEISRLTSGLISLNDNKLTSEAMSKIILLVSISSDYKTKLELQETKLDDIRVALVQAEDFIIVTPPDVPMTFFSPNLLFYLVLSFIVGLFLSLSLVFIQESINQDN